MVSGSALKPWIFAPVPRAASARDFAASVLLFSEKHRRRRTVNATANLSTGEVKGHAENISAFDTQRDLMARPGVYTRYPCTHNKVIGR